MKNIVCLDASPFIDYYRKKVKEKTFFYQFTKNYIGFVLPVTAHFEIMAGSNVHQHLFWKNIFADLHIIPYQPYINETALDIINQLKVKRKSIEYKDLLIATTARHYNYSLTTINEKHFQYVEGLNLITPSSFTI